VVGPATRAASLVVAMLATAACGDPGPIGGIPSGVLETDAALDSAVDAGGLDAIALDALPPSEAAAVPDPFAGAPAYVKGTDTAGPLSLSDPAGPHHIGASCGNGSCHAPGACGAAPCFLIGGTAYDEYKGTTPAAGAEIRVLDMQGHAASCYVGPNGNFRILADAGVTLPAIVGIRDGTTTRPMVTVLGNGMCATSSCHSVGGSPATGAVYPVHVP